MQARFVDSRVKRKGHIFSSLISPMAVDLCYSLDWILSRLNRDKREEDLYTISAYAENATALPHARFESRFVVVSHA